MRAADGNARAAEKRRKIDSGVYANPATRCGGNMLVPSSLSNVYVPSCLMDGRPLAAGPYHPAEAFSDLSMWHSQDGVTGTLPHQRLKERLALAAGGRPLEFEVPRHAFHLPPLRELDSDGKPIGTNSLTTGWCDCSRGLKVRFYPIGCRLPLCCRADAVPNNGWLDAMDRDDRVYYCSD